MRHSVPVPTMTPVEQIRAPRMPRRLVQLVVGLWLFGASMALMLRSHLGLDPWDVFHQGVAAHVPLTIGQVTILTGPSCCFSGSR